MELLGRQETWNITYDHALGETASWFYTRIRDEAAIYGRRCARSGCVLVPPRSFSDETLQPTTDWVKVGPGGRIEAFTMVYEKSTTCPIRLMHSGTCCWTGRTPPWAVTFAALTCRT